MVALEEQSMPRLLGTIEDQGFAVVSSVLRQESLRTICDLVDQPFQDGAINGKSGFVQYGCRRFLLNPLTLGREIIEAYTNPTLINFCDHYSGTPVHLSSFRIYQTFASRTEKMEWHVDNKTKRYDESSACWRTVFVSEEKSLSLMLFATDVVDGGLQVVPGSHRWSDELSSGHIKALNQGTCSARKDIVTCNGLHQGAAILFDNRIIHRAKPFTSGPVRMVLLGQYQSEQMPPGEPILLDTRDIESLSDHQRRVLRFGQASSAQTYPVGRPFELFGVADWIKLGGMLAKDRVMKAVKCLG